MDQSKEAATSATQVSVGEDDSRRASTSTKTIPWKIKILAVLLVSLIGFGSHWSSGVTGAMKSTIKKASQRARKQQHMG
jgi:hypothetical protein